MAEVKEVMFFKTQCIAVDQSVSEKL